MINFPRIPLNDSNIFQIVSGLWKGYDAPLKRCAVLRSTNFRSDGLINYSDIAELDVEERHFSQRQLLSGDIIIERSGGGPKQPVGRIGFFSPPSPKDFCTSNFTSIIRIKNHSILHPHFVSFYLHYLYVIGETEKLQRATTGIRNLDWNEYLKFEIPCLPFNEQNSISTILHKSRLLYLIEENQIKNTLELKNTIMLELFTKGLRHEGQKDTEFGLIPTSWSVNNIGNHYSVTSGGTPSRDNPEYWNKGTIPWVKSTDVNYSNILATTEYITESGIANSAAKLLESGAVLMAMYGQGVTRGRVAILKIKAACNQACAAMYPLTKNIDQKFLFYFLTHHYENIRRFAHGGQQQNLNLEIIRNLPIAFPENLTEQLEIVSILEVIDKKIDIHTKKQAVLKDLFKALLHKLMTGEARVNELDLSALEKSADIVGAFA